jgi:hypothetical protein
VLAVVQPELKMLAATRQPTGTGNRRSNRKKQQGKVRAILTLAFNRHVCIQQACHGDAIPNNDGCSIAAT